MSGATRAIAPARVKAELARMNKSPPHGIGMWPVGDNLETLEALIEGPDDSPFAGGEFRLSIKIPALYPNAPPIIKFRTKIYHPNVDSAGNICLDSLKPEPAGSWRPSKNLEGVLTQIRLLMTEPNVDDPLDAQIAKELRETPEKYRERAKKMTKEFAVPVHASASSDESDE